MDCYQPRQAPSGAWLLTEEGELGDTISSHAPTVAVEKYSALPIWVQIKASLGAGWAELLMQVITWAFHFPPQ